MAEQVRPTKRALESASLDIPHLGVSLSVLEHELLVRARAVVEMIDSGGGKRVVSIKDRVVFKVKTDDWRGALVDVGSDLGHLEPAEVDCIRSAQAWWWVGDIGHRRGDSKQSDFYEKLRTRAFRQGANTCDSGFLLPQSWDAKRLDAEMALAFVKDLQRQVRQLAAKSLRDGVPATGELARARLRFQILLRPDGIVYIAIGAKGNPDPKFFALLLSSLPSVRQEDWAPEPGEGLGIEPEPGEIVWSAILTEAAQTELRSVE